jgi:nucleotide-binding universal stress UspA family protein
VFKRVLIGIDGQQGGRDEIVLAKQLAAPDAAITLAHIYGAGLMPGRGAALVLSAELEESTRLLERERDAASLDARLVPDAEHLVVRGLHQLAEQQAADVLVIGSCRRGLLGRVLLGNDTISGLTGAPCAVAIAPSGYVATAHRLSTIGVGCDGSQESGQARRRSRARGPRALDDRGDLSSFAPEQPVRRTDL